MIKFFSAGSTCILKDGRSVQIPGDGYYNVCNSGVVRISNGDPIWAQSAEDIVPRKGHQVFSDDYGDDYSSNYKSTGPVNLKCKCYRCDQEFVPDQFFDYFKSKYKITFNHCGKTETIYLTDKQIEENNKSGLYYAFMY